MRKPNMSLQEIKQAIIALKGKPIDMEVIDKQNVLNKYSLFEANALSLFSATENVDKEMLFKHLKENFVCDDDLLEKYWNTFLYKMQSN